MIFFFFSSRRRHTRFDCDWSSDVCSSDLAELYYRLRALDKAEAETNLALELASTNWELALARRQLTEIRRLRREGTQKPTWTKSLKVPTIGFVVLVMAISWFFMVWK